MKNKPVVVKGMAAAWPALKKWNLKYLSDTVGQFNCWMTTMINFNAVEEIATG